MNTSVKWHDKRHIYQIRIRQAKKNVKREYCLLSKREGCTRKHKPEVFYTAEFASYQIVYCYLFIKWLPGPYRKILRLKSHSTDRSEVSCDVTEGLAFFSTDRVSS